MIKKKEKLSSIRIRLFFILSFAVFVIIILLILLNNVVLETFYIYSKKNTLKDLYHKINDYYNDINIEVDLESELTKIAIRNNFDILIKTNGNLNIYTSNENFMDTINEFNAITEKYNNSDKDIIYAESNMNIVKVKENKSNITYIFLSAKLDNGYLLFIRMPISSVQESVRISNRLLYLIGSFTIIIAAIIISFITKRFAEPIMELNDIAKKMSELDFSKKYEITDGEDEISTLGKSINKMSDKLENTIKQLKETNIELERDVEEKSKIDEMRKQFISDVSHELKTPIALIQGYAEGLAEDVNTDPESRKFYANVIIDEANKMDVLVKQLLELMKLEYGKREFNNTKFDVVELIKEVIRKCSLMIEGKEVEIQYIGEENIDVYADSFYIDQILTNYLTNAIKHVDEVNGENKIIVKSEIKEKDNKVRISVFNTGERIADEDLNRIWMRFYKIDTSRNREAGGSGIGLSLVKAIMNNYQNKYGVENKENGVEFYFELDREDM